MHFPVQPFLPGFGVIAVLSTFDVDGPVSLTDETGFLAFIPLKDGDELNWQEEPKDM